MSLFDGPLFGCSSEKDRRRRKNREYQRKGKAAEDMVEMELQMEYDEVNRVHEGADFHAKRRNLWTGEVEETKVEVKSGNSRLTKRQREERKNSDNYEVRRRKPLFY